MCLRIQVLIPTHGRKTLLARTLMTLGACRLPKNYAGTIVIENGPQEGAEAAVADAAAAYPDLRLRYMHVEHANKSHALNEAVATVKEGLVVFFDDDVRLHPYVLEAYAEAAREAGQGFYFGGPVAVDYERPPPPWLVPYLPHSARGYALHDRGTMAEEYLGFNWAAFALDLKAAAGFDPAFGPGSSTGATGQESEMQKRMRAQGLRPRDVEGALVWHYVPRSRCSLRWLLRRHYRMGLSRGLHRSLGGRREDSRTTILRLVRTAASLLKRALMMDREGAVGALCGLCANAGAVRSVLGSWIQLGKR
jgi:glycosyltransferase involved in cell wall biosynthesis